MASDTLRIRKRATTVLRKDVFDGVCEKVKLGEMAGEAAADALEQMASPATVWFAKRDFEDMLKRLRGEPFTGEEAANYMLSFAVFGASDEQGQGDAGDALCEKPTEAAEPLSWERAVGDVFEKADLDHSGNLDRAEFDWLVTTTVSLVGSDMKTDFAALDTNGDGQIDAEEFKAFTAKLRQALGERGEPIELSTVLTRSIRLAAELEELGGKVSRKVLELQGEIGELKLLAELATADAELSTKTADLMGLVQRNVKQLSSLDVAAMMKLPAKKQDQRDMEQAFQTMADEKERISKVLLDSAKTHGQVSALERQISESSSCKVACTQAKQARAIDIFKKGFSLRQLLTFVDDKCHKEGLIGAHHTTAEVVKKIIIPETANRKCCYADMFAGGPKEPKTLMSHWWGNNFLHLVKAICQHASGKTELFLHMYTEAELDKTFWLCIFGVNQHHAICHGQGCTCGAPKHHVGITCQMNKFALVMESIPNHALAMDLTLTTLKRVWVLSELDEAMNGSNRKETVFCGVVGDAMRDEPQIPSVRNAEASFESDRQLIVGGIERRPGGVERFDNELRAKVLDEIAVLRVFYFASMGNTEGVEAEVKRRMFLLKRASAHGRGESLLHVAARYGYDKMVRMLLAQGADSSQRSMLEWTALHYAGVCFNPETACNIVTMLLEARADPNAEHIDGRTPLEEAMCTDPDFRGGVVQILNSAGSREPRADVREALMDPLREGPFLPHPKDAMLFSHWVLRMDSWQRPDLTMRIIQPIDGEIQVLSAWVKPVEFGIPVGVPVPSSGKCAQIIIAAIRLARYIKHRWPLWEFDAIVFRYTTPEKPQHYRVDLRAQTLAQIASEDMKAVVRKMHDVFTVETTVPCSIRFLYP